MAEVLGLKDVHLQDLVRLIEGQCRGILGFDEVGNGAWTKALHEGNKVVVTTTFEELPSVEGDRREALADNGMSQTSCQNRLQIAPFIYARKYAKYN